MFRFICALAILAGGCAGKIDATLRADAEHHRTERDKARKEIEVLKQRLAEFEARNLADDSEAAAASPPAEPAPPALMNAVLVDPAWPTQNTLYLGRPPPSYGVTPLSIPVRNSAKFPVHGMPEPGWMCAGVEVEVDYNPVVVVAPADAQSIAAGGAFEGAVPVQGYIRDCPDSAPRLTTFIPPGSTGYLTLATPGLHHFHFRCAIPTGEYATDGLPILQLYADRVEDRANPRNFEIAEYQLDRVSCR